MSRDWVDDNELYNSHRMRVKEGFSAELILSTDMVVGASIEVSMGYGASTNWL